MTRLPEKWICLIAIAIGSFMATIMFTSINVALPSLKEGFGAEFNTVQWVVLSYLLASATLMPIVGRVADMVGKKSLYLSGIIVFVIGSLLSGIAPSMNLLIIFRILQGIGGAFMTALSLAIITDIFPPEERGRAIGISGSILSVGIVMGPTLGGLLTDLLSWRWIFLLTLLPGLIGFVLSQRFIPSYSVKKGQRFDFFGAVLLFLVLLCFMLALTFGQGLGFGHPIIIGLFVSFLLLSLVFIWFETRIEDPIIQLKLFKIPQLSISLISGFTTFVSLSGAIFVLPFFLSSVLGYSPKVIGLIMSVSPIVLVVMAPIAGILSDKFGERPVAIVGLCFMIIGYLCLAGLNADSSVMEVILRFLPIGIGSGTFQTPNNSAIMGAVDKTRSGIASSLLALTRTVGSSAGIAVIGTLWAVRVLAYAPEATEVTNAAKLAQVAGVRDIFLVISFIMILSLALVLWHQFYYRQVTKSVSG